MKSPESKKIAKLDADRLFKTTGIIHVVIEAYSNYIVYREDFYQGPKEDIIYITKPVVKKKTRRTKKVKED